MTDEEFAASLARRFPPRVEPAADPLADLTRERDAAVAALAKREAELGRALASLAQMRGERDRLAEAMRGLFTTDVAVAFGRAWASPAYEAEACAAVSEAYAALSAVEDDVIQRAPCRPASCAEGLPPPTGYVHPSGHGHHYPGRT